MLTAWGDLTHTWFGMLGELRLSSIASDYI